MISMVLVTQPNFDLTTNYISYWSDEVVDIAKKKGISITVLKGRRANKNEFESVVSKIRPRLIFLNGHGDYDTVAGQKDEILVKAGENEVCLKGKIVYALSCRSGKILGEESVKKGARAYIGYKEDFVFHYSHDKITSPLKDDVAKLFLEPSNYVVTSLLKGHTVQDSWENSQRNFRKKMLDLVLRGDKVSINTYLPLLHWDMHNQVCLGDGTAKL